MTFREVTNASKYANKAKALEIDLKIKLAGDKKGYSGLDSILNMERVDLYEGTLASVTLDERTQGTRNLLDKIKEIKERKNDAT